MIRKLGLAFVLTALTLVACGRQVTPDRNGGAGGASGLNPGFMQIKFRTASPMDFTNIRYVIVFNTSGNGIEPYTNGYLNNFANFSFAFAIGGSGVSLPTPTLFEYLKPQGAGGGTATQQIQIPYSPQQVQLITNSDGQNQEFTLRFSRALFLFLQATPAPSASMSPSPSPSPSAAPTSSASPTASPTPASMPTSSAQAIWYINFFTTDVNGSPLDALGTNGKDDVNFTWANDVSTVFDVQNFVPGGATPASPLSAQLAGGEISNNP
ncbi:MAG: hypothetical protein ABI182_08720 [Candidatus Baltobacteraceae bacterium]